MNFAAVQEEIGEPRYSRPFVEEWWPAGLGALLALLALYGSLRVRRRQRLIRTLPTSKAHGVFMGLVELKGTADSGRPLQSYLSGEDCVHYAWSVEEHWSRTVSETYTDGDGKTRTRTRHESGWQTVAEGGAMIAFYLRDETGVVRVRPEGAKIEPVEMFESTCDEDDPLYYEKGPEDAVSNSDHRRRFSEEGIPLGTGLYVLGCARERRDVVAPEIAADEKAPMYLITARSEKEVTSGLGTKAWMLGVLGLILTLAGIFARHALVRPVDVHALPPGDFVLGGLLYLWAWFLGWTLMAYNSLVELRNRVRQAVSLIDVQLKRRNDLIPTLVATVQGYREHEASVQAEVAALRAQLAATPPGVSGPDPSACLPAIRAIVERYPELKANEAFLSLQHALSDTEQRLALARSYLNDIATHYNSCLEVVPDRFLAKLAGMKPQPLMAAAGFERAPVTVDL